MSGLRLASEEGGGSWAGRGCYKRSGPCALKRCRTAGASETLPSTFKASSLATERGRCDPRISSPWSTMATRMREPLLSAARSLPVRTLTAVCDGRVPLAEAQREIAMDWIAAYRKYVGRVSRKTAMQKVRSNPLRLDGPAHRARPAG